MYAYILYFYIFYVKKKYRRCVKAKNHIIKYFGLNFYFIFKNELNR